MEKIIIVTDTWHPQVNGVIRSIEEILSFLKEKGFEVAIIHPGIFRTLPLLFYPEIRLAIFPRHKIKKIIEENKPNYIHIATEGPLGLAMRAVCLKKKIKFTTSYHWNLPHYVEHYIKIKNSLLSDLAYGYFRWFHNVGNGIMASSEGLKDELKRHNFKNVVVSSLGVDAKLFTRNSDPSLKKIYPFSPPIFVYFGRIAEEKNIKEFLECKLMGTKLVIGDGPQRQKLEEQYGESAVFVGWKKGKELVDLLSVCDVFVFPSRTETFGLTIIEALACGVPVAAHKVMGPKDIITQGVDGFLDENLENAAIKCLGLSREKCREKAMKFSWEESANSFIKNLVKA